MISTNINHVVYWTIPQIDEDGVVVSEQHYALNLSEVHDEDAARIESMLRSCRSDEDGSDDIRHLRTDPKITEYRHLFRPFIEVKKHADDLCRFSAVWLPFMYAEYAYEQAEPRHHTHPSVRPLAGAG